MKTTNRRAFITTTATFIAGGLAAGLALTRPEAKPDVGQGIPNEPIEPIKFTPVRDPRAKSTGLQIFNDYNQAVLDAMDAGVRVRKSSPSRRMVTLHLGPIANKGGFEREEALRMFRQNLQRAKLGASDSVSDYTVTVWDGLRISYRFI